MPAQMSALTNTLSLLLSEVSTGAVFLQYNTFSITKKDNIEILLFQYCSLDHVYFLVLPQQSSLLGLYGPILFHLLGNTGKYTLAARTIRRINSSNIALTGRTYLKYNFQKLRVSVLRLKSGYTVKYSLSPLGNPSGSALGISLGLRLYFTVYPSFCHNTDTL